MTVFVESPPHLRRVNERNEEQLNLSSIEQTELQKKTIAYRFYLVLSSLYIAGLAVAAAYFLSVIILAIAAALLVIFLSIVVIKKVQLSSALRREREQRVLQEQAEADRLFMYQFVLCLCLQAAIRNAVSQSVIPPPAAEQTATQAQVLTADQVLTTPPAPGSQKDSDKNFFRTSGHSLLFPPRTEQVVSEAKASSHTAHLSLV